MKNLKIKGKTAEMELNINFYPKVSIEKTIEDFSEIFKSSITENSEKITVNLETIDDKTDVKEAVYGFLNYLIAETKNNFIRV